MLKHCKVYNDGENWISVPIFRGCELRVKDSDNPRKMVGTGLLVKENQILRMQNLELEEECLEECREEVDEKGGVVRRRRRPKNLDMQRFILEGVNKHMNREKTIDHILARFFEEFGFDAIPKREDAEKELLRFLANRHGRIKRYKRKVWGNQWNYFVTITYDDEKWADPDDFEKTVRQTLNSFHSRHGWKYIGVWEKGEERGRKHFHALVYIPDGEMVGELFADKHYSTKKHTWEYFTNNTYFQERFGISYFESVVDGELRGGKLSDYLLKYILKSDERLVYSRGVPGELFVVMDPVTECAMPIKDKFGYVRYILARDWMGKPQDPIYISLCITEAEREQLFLEVA